MENLPEDMDALTFNAWLMDIITPIMEAGGEVVAMMGKHAVYGEIPLGVATLEYRGKIAYPHAVWFPDASARDRLEIGLAFFIELKKNHMGWVTAEAKDEKYFNHLGKYGVVRKVGKLRDYFSDGVHATLYQTVGH